MQGDAARGATAFHLSHEARLHDQGCWGRPSGRRWSGVVRVRGYAVAVASLAVVLAASACSTGSGGQATVAAREEAHVRAVVEAFGGELQGVSLESADVTKSIRAMYGGLVAEDLIAVWVDDPSRAPGRAVSSPWPDSIEIDTIAKTIDGTYEVTGSIIEISSIEAVEGGAAATIPVALTVQQIGGKWFITSYLQEPSG